MNTEICEVVQMAVEEVNTAHFNPPHRTTEKEVRDLAATIAQHGIIYPLTMSIEDKCLADGHRRLAAAKLVGLPSVPVQWKHGSAAELWAVMNRTAKSIEQRDWWIASSREIAIVANASRRMGNQLASLLRVLGPEDYEEMAQRRSPGIFTTAVRVANYVGFGKDDAFLRECLIWLDKHDQQRPVIDALKKGAQAPVSAFLAAIREDRPLRVRRVYE